jgi:hypothetical protein
MQIDKKATDLGAAQGGVILRSQAYELGFTEKMIRTRLATRTWERATQDAFFVTQPRDDIDRLRAAVAALRGAVVSHESAARLHAFPMVAGTPNTVTVHASTTHVFPGVMVRRSRDLEVGHVVTVDRLNVTSPERTLMDMASRLDGRRFRMLFDELIVSRRVDLERLRLIHDSVGRRGKPGSAFMSAALGACEDQSEVTISALESLGRRTLVRFGLPEPVHEYPVPWAGAQRFDAAFVEARVALEWDSRRWHTRRADMNRDRARDRSAMANGWLIVRVTWQDLRETPAETMAELGIILRTRGLAC